MADKKKEEKEQLAYNPVSGQDEPGVAGDESHRDRENDAQQVSTFVQYSAAEQARAGEEKGDIVSGDEMVAVKAREAGEGS